MPLDAHHILKREWMPNGGYVAANGITVCDDCHLKAEEFYNGQWTCPEGFAPRDLFQKIGSDAKQAFEASMLLSQ